MLFVTLDDDEEDEGRIGISPNDRSVLCLQVDMMVALLLERDIDNTVQGLYDRLKAGQLPAEIRPGTCTLLT